MATSDGTGAGGVTKARQPDAVAEGCGGRNGRTTRAPRRPAAPRGCRRRSLPANARPAELRALLGQRPLGRFTGVTSGGQRRGVARVRVAIRTAKRQIGPTAARRLERLSQPSLGRSKVAARTPPLHELVEDLSRDRASSVKVLAASSGSPEASAADTSTSSAGGRVAS